VLLVEKALDLIDQMHPPQQPNGASFPPQMRSIFLHWQLELPVGTIAPECASSTENAGKSEPICPAPPNANHQLLAEHDLFPKTGIHFSGSRATRPS
jgi:hypothetical protein